MPMDTENSRQQEAVTTRTEEVQAIIDRMPTHWVKWFALGIGCLVLLVVILGFWIKYPDTVDGEISVTASKAPVRLVANSNGRIKLLLSNKQKVNKGDVIAYIESGADYRHILLVDSLRCHLSANMDKGYPLPDSLLLGEASTAYNSFFLAYMQYRQLQESHIYETLRANLHQQITVDGKIIDNLQKELILKDEILATNAERLEKDSMLLAIHGISQQEYQEKRATHLNYQEMALNLRSNLLAKQAEINKSQMELQRIILEETETKMKAYAELIAQQNALSNVIQLWKEHYLAYSPMEGHLEYLGFWRDDSYIQAGKEWFSVIPEKNDVIGEVMIPAYGAGKVKTGQKVNVKMSNYPYEEYGMLEGKVDAISRMTYKLDTAEGMADAYLVTVTFPQGLVTNFGKSLPIDFESKGSAEIVTKRKRLIERLFDNLKAKGGN